MTGRPSRNYGGPNYRVLLLFLALAGLAVLIGSGLRGALAAESVAAVSAEKTVLRITLDDGRVLAGQDLVGVTLAIAGEDGKPAPVRIDAVQPDPYDPAGETLLYAFTVEDTATGGRRNICEPDAEGQQWGVPLTVDENGAALPGGAFSIACMSGARGKCLRFLFKPWGEDVGGVSRRDLYATCVHAVRADFCGDGVARTVAGTQIELYDRLGISGEPYTVGMSFEAAWGPEGAVCIARPRIADLGTLDEILAACPRLNQAPHGAACTEAAAPAAALHQLVLTQASAGTEQLGAKAAPRHLRHLRHLRDKALLGPVGQRSRASGWI